MNNGFSDFISVCKLTMTVERARRIPRRTDMRRKLRHCSALSGPFRLSYSPGIITVYSMFSLNFVYSVEFLSAIERRRLPWPEIS